MRYEADPFWLPLLRTVRVAWKLTLTFEQILHYLPVWAIPSKISDGLVEGYKRFEI
jgi:hypothetical protein